jgi:hypothetical protein
VSSGGKVGAEVAAGKVGAEVVAGKVGAEVAAGKVGAEVAARKVGAEVAAGIGVGLTVVVAGQGVSSWSGSLTVATSVGAAGSDDGAAQAVKISNNKPTRVFFTFLFSVLRWG